MSEDLQGCEHCSKHFPIEEMTSMGDFWICQECYSGWKAEFDACDHDWVSDIDHMGDAGKYCQKCSGFVRDDDFDGLFGKAPAVTPADRGAE